MSPKAPTLKLGINAGALRYNGSQASGVIVCCCNTLWKSPLLTKTEVPPTKCKRHCAMPPADAEVTATCKTQRIICVPTLASLTNTLENSSALTRCPHHFAAHHP